MGKSSDVLSTYNQPENDIPENLKYAILGLVDRFHATDYTVSFMPEGGGVCVHITSGSTTGLFSLDSEGNLELPDTSNSSWPF